MFSLRLKNSVHYNILSLLVGYIKFLLVPFKLSNLAWKTLDDGIMYPTYLYIMFYIQQGSLKGSAGPFELIDKPGTEEVILKRTFGNEQIAVTCLVESEYPGGDEEAEGETTDEEASEKAHNESENDEEEEEVVSKHVDILRFTVTITKETSMPALEFECSFFRGADEVTIESISFLNEDSSEKTEGDEETRPYEGPDFKYAFVLLLSPFTISHLFLNKKF